MFKFIPNYLKKSLYCWYYQPFKRNERRRLLNYPFTEDSTLNGYLKYNKINNNPRSFLNRMLLFDIKHELPNWELNRTDKMTMAHAMEARVPFLDHRIVELSATIPVKHKQPNFRGKYLLKKLAMNYLPRNIVLRKKQGYKKPFFNYKYIEQLISKHKVWKKPNRSQTYSLKLLVLLFFDIWYEINVNNKSLKQMENLLKI